MKKYLFLALSCLMILVLCGSAAAATPTATFTATPTSGSAPLNVQFTDQSTGSPTSYAWDFNNDGTVDSTEQNPSYTYNTAGTYTVKLTVTNAEGSDEEIKTDYITANDPSPTVDSIDPADGSANVATGKKITVTFSEAIQAGAAFDNIILWNNNVNGVKPIIKQINGNILTITPTSSLITGNSYTLTIPVNAVKDLAGNNLETSSSSTFTAVAQEFTVLNINPADGSVNVPLNKLITVTFTKPIQAGAGYNNIILWNNNVNGLKPIHLSINGNVLIINTSPIIPGHSYTLTLPSNAIQDLASNVLTADYSSTFTAINPIPTVVNIDPVDGSVNVATGKKITVTFSEAIQAGAAFDNIILWNDVVNGVKPIIKQINGNILTITPTTPLITGHIYTLTIPVNAVQDLDGIALSTSSSSTFTAEALPIDVVSMDPADGSTNVPTDQVITVTFTRPIQADIAYEDIILMNNDVEGLKPIHLSIRGNVLTIYTSPLIPGNNYTLTIPANAIQDLAGNNLVADYSSSFTIAA